MPPVDGVSGSSLKLVALALADYANREGEGVWPSVNTLASITDLTRRTVQAALAGLREHGIIVQIRPATNRLTAVYRFGPWYLPPVRNPNARGAMAAPLGRSDRTPRGAVIAPEPSLNRQGTGGARAESEPEPNPAAAARARQILAQLASSPAV